uniref:Putative trypsin-like serine protease n=1 Tax=Corethrella appendiculata TaxID=1370023 RepID=U5ESW9_9DIPT
MKFLILFVLCMTLFAYEVNTFECGKRKTKISGLIKSGYTAVRGDWPWHIGIYHEKGLSWTYECGGTLISEKIILTAAHCVYGTSKVLSPSIIQVKLGKYNLKIKESSELTKSISKIIIHEDYESSTFRHDIALLELSENILFNDYIQPACLWENNDQTSNSVKGTNGFVIGWGYIDNDTVSDILNQATIPMIDYLDCIVSNPYGYSTMLNRFNYCAGYQNGTSVCNGDSGGGMFYKIGNEWQIRGIVSFSELRDDDSYICDAKKYAVFTDVAAHIDWIKSKCEINPSRSKDEILDHPNYGLINSHDCGVNSFSANVPEYLKPVFLNYPWMVQIKYNSIDSDSGFQIRCFGTLINKYYVLTTAHCTQVSQNELKSVILGEYDMSTNPDCYRASRYENIKCTSPYQEINVKAIIRNEFIRINRTNDIALLRLETPADTTKENVKTICLPTGEEFRLTEIDEFIVSGWAQILSQGGRNLDATLFRYNVETLNETTCDVRKFNMTWNFIEHICSKSGVSENNGCKKTLSGSPLQSIQLINNQYKYTQFGILALGRPCDEDSVMGSVRITTHLKWILDNISGENFVDTDYEDIFSYIKPIEMTTEDHSVLSDLSDRLIFV